MSETGLADYVHLTQSGVGFAKSAVAPDPFAPFRKYRKSAQPSQEKPAMTNTTNPAIPNAGDMALDAFAQATQNNAFRGITALIETFGKEKLGDKWPALMEDDRARAVVWFIASYAVLSFAGAGSDKIPNPQTLAKVAEIGMRTTADDGMKALIQHVIPSLQELWGRIMTSREVAGLLSATEKPTVAEFLNTPVGEPVKVG